LSKAQAVKAKMRGLPLSESVAMKQISKVVNLVACAVLFVFILANVAWPRSDIEAYIDPGTGSLILQILLAVLVGAGFAVKIFWANIKSFFSRLFAKKRDDSDN
jgi:hypothetical protein